MKRKWRIVEGRRAGSPVGCIHCDKKDLLAGERESGRGMK